MIKPTDYMKFVETIKVIDLYWTLSELPEQSGEMANTRLKADIVS
jgi:hypothetical protein